MNHFAKKELFLTQIMSVNSVIQFYVQNVNILMTTALNVMGIYYLKNIHVLKHVLLDISNIKSKVKIFVSGALFLAIFVHQQ